ncbi:Fpg/Nei family DNA glycosylase [Microbulbifer magnicolonia]|uniref:Fpg/Nei family DNA glycosylase n=1 Tax=Microbulbifer magnicolonia TaxID=3109744 RepID=UPI002B411EC9|nr:DNA-formamidopyrimidine glycosylase family protein [Microbulbifer sp. GG15]
MPELPEVELFRRYFNATALHQSIDRTQVLAPSLLVDASPQGLGRALKRNRFQSTSRHGKYLFAQLDTGKCLVLHFGMSGRLDYGKRDRGPPEYTRFSVRFESGYQLDYVAPRKLGRIALTDSPEAWVAQRQLGPDALAIGEEEFVHLAGGRRAGVKSWLMDQQSIAGIGNEYSDEILFHAGMHPQRKLTELRKSDFGRLFKKMRAVLQTAIDSDVDAEQLPRAFLLPHRHRDGRCPGCDVRLETVKVAGRTAWFCPKCQQR